MSGGRLGDVHGIPSSVSAIITSFQSPNWELGSETGCGEPKLTAHGALVVGARHLIPRTRSMSRGVALEADAEHLEPVDVTFPCTLELDRLMMPRRTAFVIVLSQALVALTESMKAYF